MGYLSGIAETQAVWVIMIYNYTRDKNVQVQRMKNWTE